MATEAPEMNLKRVRIEGDGELAALLRGTIEQILGGNVDGARPLLDMLEDRGDRQAPRLRNLYDKLDEHRRLHVGRGNVQIPESCRKCLRGELVWMIAHFDCIAKALAVRLRKKPSHSEAKCRRTIRGHS